MTNSGYGKFSGSRKNRVNVKFARKKDDLFTETDKQLFNSFKVFDEKLAVVSSTKPNLLGKRHATVGPAVLVSRNTKSIKFTTK